LSASSADLLTAYVRAFETLNPDAVVPFYHLPCTFIAPQNLFVAPDAETARAVAAHLMEQAKSQGYRRTEIRNLKTRQLAADLAWLTGVFVRLDEEEKEVGRFGFTYLVRTAESTWKIAVAVAHDVSPAEA
jgi:hypothetical protein